MCWTKMRAAGHVVLFAVSIIISGCSASLAGDGFDERTCVGDSECNSPDICAYGVCAAPSALTDVHIEIEPPMSSGLAAQQFLDVDTLDTDRSEFVLRSQVEVRGMLQSADGAPIMGRVVAIPEARIPGRTLVPAVDTQLDGTFTLSLTDGERYDVRVYPDDESIAPWFRGETLVADRFGSQTLDVTFVAESVLWSLTGVITAGEGAGAIGIPELAVRLLDGTRRVSSTGYTDENGLFSLRVPSTAAGDLLLEVRPTDQNPQFPIVVVPVVAEGSADLGEVSLGNVASPVAFQGRVAGPDGSPIIDASIHIYGAIGNGEIRRLIVTDATGRFDVPLPPGEYDFAVVASVLDPSAGMAQFPGVEVSAESDGLVVPLEPRSALTGVVKDADGLVVSGATLEFLRRGQPGEQTTVAPVLENASWSFQATTVNDGAFLTAVDPGRYRVRVLPPPGSGLPQHTFVADVYAAPDPLDIVLPAPGTLAGTVLDADGVSLPGAVVRVFSAVSAEGQQAISLGDGLTDEAGNFGVLVPDVSGASSTDTLGQ